MDDRLFRSIHRWIDQPISRRVLLQSISAAGAGVSVLPFLRAPEARADSKSCDASGVKVSDPNLSLAERNRRWAAVRAIMAEPGWNLDAIITTNPGDEAYARYLTQVGGPAGGADVVFPRDATKPVEALLNGSRPRNFWAARLAAWTADGKLVLSSDGGPEDVAGRLAALGVARVGVAKLEGTRFDPLGLVTAKYLEMLKAALPVVTFVPIEKWKINPPDPGPVDEPAMIKSAEEQQSVSASVAAAEKAIETILKAAQSSAKQQADLWFPAFIAMFLETGEEPDRLSITLNERANVTLGAPTADPLQTGQIISEEIEAKVQGFSAQVNHSIFVGNKNTPGYDYYETTINAAIHLFQDAVQFINSHPGLSTGDLLGHYAAEVAAAGAESTGVVLHSDGIGNLSRPRLGPDDVGSGEDDNIALVPGMCFDFKPSIRMKRSVIHDVGSTNRWVQIGENILITPSGAVRLGKRELEPLRTKGR